MRLNDRAHSLEYPPSYYAATRNDDHRYPVLEEHVEVDVCVIGGGFSGLSTALHLTQKGYKVALVEQCRVGWGASGRNGGQVIGGFGSQTQKAIDKQHGQELGQVFWEMGVECCDIVRDHVARFNIDCDLTWSYYDAAARPNELRDLEASMEDEIRRGYPHKQALISSDETRQYVGTNRYIGGLTNEGWGHCHPLNLARGEAKALADLGGLIFEGSEAKNITYGARPTITTDKGQVTADFLVFCGNAYLGDLQPQLSWKVLPAGSYIIATEPLDEDLANKLLPTRAAVCDQRFVLDYYRMSADRRILFGGGTTYHGGHPKDIIARMRPKMLRVFPELENTKIDYAWGGNMAMTLSRSPHVGRLADNVYFTQGYSGHGLAPSHITGKIIAEAIAGQAERFDIFSSLTHLPFPGGKYLRQPTLFVGMLYVKLRDELGI
ncbi:MAG: FAD-dependent oxidoreductase [Alphaproteobacteria bacterium]|nr:MAG: FAD-dependent oxidoreductase [Alphaproteobacteria bacterium]